MLRIAFAGTPEFAARALAALAQTGHEIALVLTQPDRPAGRGRGLQASPVKQLAQTLGLKVWQPPTLREPQTQQVLAQAGLDLMVVAAYGLILPQAVLDIPRLGCINIHASLLPRWRGAAPIQRAIEAGDHETGITIMQMDAGLDTGPMLATVRTPIEPQDTGGSLHDRLAALGGEAVVAALTALEAGTLYATPQPSEGVTYARKLGRSDGQLDFDLSARALVDRIRAFDPVPGSLALLERGEPVPVKIWRAEAMPDAQPDTELLSAAPPGTILGVDGDGLRIACRGGAIAALELQKPGGRRVTAQAFLRGFPMQAGERFRRFEAT
jgi:methionyl-tRNA formyltransferase